MPTTNLGLPLIAGNMTANVPRDMNALAEEIDAKVASKVVVEGLATKTSVTTIDERVTTHLADNEMHITNAERTIWNAKLKGAVSLSPGANLNWLQETGFYYGYDFINGAEQTISTFEVINYSPDWIVQMQYVPGSPTRIYTRSRYNGNAWSPWVLIETANNKNIPNGYAGLDANGKLSPSTMLTVEGSYAGTGGDKFISLGFTPKLVIVHGWFNGYGVSIMQGFQKGGAILRADGGSSKGWTEPFDYSGGATMVPDFGGITTGGFLVSGNLHSNGTPYTYTAIG